MSNNCEKRFRLERIFSLSKRLSDWINILRKFLGWEKTREIPRAQHSYIYDWECRKTESRGCLLTKCLFQLSENISSRFNARPIELFLWLTIGKRWFPRRDQFQCEFSGAASRKACLVSRILITLNSLKKPALNLPFDESIDHYAARTQSKLRDSNRSRRWIDRNGNDRMKEF